MQDQRNSFVEKLVQLQRLCQSLFWFFLMLVSFSISFSIYASHAAIMQILASNDPLKISQLRFNRWLVYYVCLSLPYELVGLLCQTEGQDSVR